MEEQWERLTWWPSPPTSTRVSRGLRSYWSEGGVKIMMDKCCGQMKMSLWSCDKNG